jgi:hypothetical protein
MSGPDDPRWLADVGDELRQEVPVRAAWRARLLDDIANAPRPSLDAAASVDNARAHRRRIVLSPLAGIAAALTFAALGAGATWLAVSSRTTASTIATVDSATKTGANATLASNTPAADREMVRFELAAPRAAHVALVGSFNEWNPVATPLERDASTGKWIVSLRLPPGRHVYAFVVDGDVTADPAAPRAADDDFGSANSVLLVGGRSS